MKLKQIISTFIGAGCVLSQSLASQPEAAPKPSIIFIIADDLGYGDLSCYGQEHFTTPNIDRLAESGLQFTRHYSGATVCSPSRCSLMTGKDGGHATVRGNGPHTIRDEEVTVAEVAKAAGYHTAMIGKSCVTGNTQTPEVVLQSGFDYFYGTTDHRDGHYRYPKFVYRNTERIDFPENQLHSGTHYDGHLYTEEALGYLADQSGDTPFFMILSYPIPHASIIAPEAERAAARPFVKEEVVFKNSKHYSNTPEVLANYIAMITIMDTAVGSIVAQLEEQQLLDNTLIVFTSDNGPAFEGGKLPKMLNSAGPLRGGKRDLYEGGIRVPFVASWPAVMEGGQQSDHASAFWDFLPTVCELTGQAAPEDIQGVSYAATLLGKEQPKHDYLYWEFHEKGGRRALQQGDWKLVQYNLNTPKTLKTELYNLAEDMAERKDLSKSHPEKLSEMLKLIEDARVPSAQFRSKGLDR
ncbi:arylsulfatase [Coraliomargarita sp. SDUM461003]|uniref:Arylsulfatase n=1 Tax=Thalassobacterium maritimum TaxID=3041265 RepID=A0ABU1AVS4_9BACT|nr:arylsulfatase [Coraliomargarita sp. SDUM461003]MDQ8208264.1 arylsulfatase [Coraliomargarita sp. SDUM461003]